MKFQLPDGDGFQEIVIKDGKKKGEVIVCMRSMEDVTRLLEQNKAAQSEGRQYFGKGTQTSMYHLGELSMLMAHELMKQGIFQDDKALRKWFNDLDHELWRIDPKRRRGNAVQSTQAAS